jgi:hypothetical protein
MVAHFLIKNRKIRCDVHTLKWTSPGSRNALPNYVLSVDIFLYPSNYQDLVYRFLFGSVLGVNTHTLVSHHTTEKNEGSCNSAPATNILV